MRRFLFSLLALAVLSAPAAAQTPTVVSGTITDPSGIPYSFAKISAQLIPTTASPTIIVNGIPTQIGGQQNATTDANGNFSMNLFCNTAGGGCSVISPASTQWQFTVQTNGMPLPQGTGPQSVVQLFTITGATQALTFTGVPALGRGVAVAKADAIAQAANIGTTPLYTVPANAGGTYRISGYAVVTQAATTSSTLPQIAITWTDNDTSTVENSIGVTTSPTTNTVGTFGSAIAGGTPNGFISVKAGTVIQYATFSYASTGATPMQYAVHIKLEYLGQ